MGAPGQRSTLEQSIVKVRAFLDAFLGATFLPTCEKTGGQDRTGGDGEVAAGLERTHYKTISVTRLPTRPFVLVRLGEFGGRYGLTRTQSPYRDGHFSGPCSNPVCTSWPGPKGSCRLLQTPLTRAAGPTKQYNVQQPCSAVPAGVSELINCLLKPVTKCRTLSRVDTCQDVTWHVLA